MPYIVICDVKEAILVPTVMSEIRNPETGALIGHEVTSEVYYQGDEVPDEGLAPWLVAKYDAGDPHTLSILQRVEGEEKPKPKARTKAAPAKATPVEENPFLDTAPGPAGNPSAGPKRIATDEAPIGQSGGLPGRKVVDR